MKSFIARIRAAFPDLATCLGFYTRLPIPTGEHAPGGFAAAQWAAPIAGAMIGATGAVATWIAQKIGLPAQIAATLALGATIALTGALHEDGLADVADGFGGGTTRERKLEIMKDSRIGTYGVAALTLAILARWSALAALAGADGSAAAIALVTAHAAARALLPGFMLLLPPARTTGLSAGAGPVSSGTACAALAVGGAVLLAGGIKFALLAAAVLALWFFAFRRLCDRQIGGQTGDTLGALEQGSEILLLFTACIIHF